MNLVVDIGNSRIKIGIYNKFNCLEQYIVENHNKINFKEIVSSKNIEKSIISSTAILPKRWINELQKQTNLVLLDSTTQLPFHNKYQSKQSVGKDRLALAAAAIYLFPKQNSLIIGCGTCITFNFINNKHQFLGGSIHPGLKMRTQALHHFTANLPQVALQKTKKLIGTTTEENLIIGTSIAAAREIDAMIDSYNVKFPQLNTIITGGDANFLVTLLKNKIFAQPNLTLIGLNYILEHHAK